MSFTNPDNAQRAEWGAIALQAFMDATRVDEDEALGDLLCSLMHYCREEDIQFLAHLNQGALHFQAEIEIEEEGEDADPSAHAVNPHHYQRQEGMAPRPLFDVVAASIVQRTADPEDETIDGDMSEPDDEFCVFDPESPEGRAVAEGRMNADGSDVEPEQAWRKTAEAEGWNIFETNADVEEQERLMRDDEDGRFEDDEAAWTHVVSCAAAGSLPHIAALEYLKAVSPKHHLEVIKR